MIGDRGSLWWSGEVGKAYFVQRSNDMVTWTYMPVIITGDGGLTDYQFTLTGEKIFFRLKSIDTMNTAPYADDFDGDGVSNWDEVRSGGSRSDPFLWATDGSDRSDYFADSNNNDMPDGWEVKHGDLGALDPHANDDEDTLTNIEEAALGTDPRKEDTDGDTVNDDIDAVPLEKMINWKRSPECRYAVVLLDEIEYDIAAFHPDQVDINDHGDVLYKGYTADRPIFEFDVKTWRNGVLYDLSNDLWEPDLSNDRKVYGRSSADLVWAPVGALSSADVNTVKIPPSLPMMEGMGHEGYLADTAKMKGADHPAYTVVPNGDVSAVMQHDGSRWQLIAAIDDSKSIDREVAAIAVGEGNGVFWKKVDDFWVETYHYGKTEIPIYGMASRTIPYGGADAQTPDSHFIFGKNAFGVLYVHSSEVNDFQTGVMLSEYETDCSVSGRGEILIGNRIWRNGKIHKLDDLLDVDGRYEVDVSNGEINKHGVIATTVREVKDKDGKDIPNAEQKEYVALLLPVDVVGLSPKLQDEAGNDIAGSEKPLVMPKRNAMVEVDPYNNRIAHREMKVKVGQPLAGKKITWTMQAFGVEDDDSLRGNWSESENHKDRFEESAAYGVYGFKKLNQASAETTVDNDGYVAIRANLPPYGFNQSVIKIQIEGVIGKIDLIKFEVPAVIVIDPGHGSGSGKIDGSNAIGGEADDSKEVEHDFALDIALKMEAEVRKNDTYKKRNVRVFLTRRTAPNIGMGARTRVARENGCDTYVSIHFNDSTNRRHRDPFYLVDSTGNLNSSEDEALGLALRQNIEAAIIAHETQAGRDADRSQYGPAHWEQNLAKGLDTLSDYASATRLGNGNVTGHTPCRAALIEIEWMSHAAADALYNTEAPANSLGKREAVRNATAKALSDGCIQNILEFTQD